MPETIGNFEIGVNRIGLPSVVSETGQRQFRIGQHLTYDDWNLYLAKGWTKHSPTPKTTYLDTLASDGAYDLSESITGSVKYNQREIVFSCYWQGERADFETLINTIEKAIHGRKLRINQPLEDDWFFSGRVSIAEYQHHGTYGEIKFEALCDPWEYARLSDTYHYNGNASDMYVVDKKTVIPEVVVNFENYGVANSNGERPNLGRKVNVTVNGQRIQLDRGFTRLSDHPFTEGRNYLEVSASFPYEFTIAWREGRL